VVCGGVEAKVQPGVVHGSKGSLMMISARQYNYLFFVPGLLVSTFTR